MENSKIILEKYFVGNNIFLFQRKLKMVLKSILCKLFGHNFRWNFVSFPDKRICKRCRLRQKSEINNKNVLTSIWTNGFEDNRTDEILINKWFKL